MKYLRIFCIKIIFLFTIGAIFCHAASSAQEVKEFLVNGIPTRLIVDVNEEDYIRNFKIMFGRQSFILENRGYFYGFRNYDDVDFDGDGILDAVVAFALGAIGSGNSVYYLCVSSSTRKAWLYETGEGAGYWRKEHIPDISYPYFILEICDWMPEFSDIPKSEPLKDLFLSHAEQAGFIFTHDWDGDGFSYRPIKVFYQSLMPQIDKLTQKPSGSNLRDHYHYAWLIYNRIAQDFRRAARGEPISKETRQSSHWRLVKKFDAVPLVEFKVVDGKSADIDMAKRATIIVYLKESLAVAKIIEIEKAIAWLIRVKEVVYLSKEEALYRFRENLQENKDILEVSISEVDGFVWPEIERTAATIKGLDGVEDVDVRVYVKYDPSENVEKALVEFHNKFLPGVENYQTQIKYPKSNDYYFAWASLVIAVGEDTAIILTAGHSEVVVKVVEKGITAVGVGVGVSKAIAGKPAEAAVEYAVGEAVEHGLKKAVGRKIPGFRSGVAVYGVLKAGEEENQRVFKSISKQKEIQEFIKDIAPSVVELQKKINLIKSPEKRKEYQEMLSAILQKRAELTVYRQMQYDNNKANIGGIEYEIMKEINPVMANQLADGKLTPNWQLSNAAVEYASGRISKYQLISHIKDYIRNNKGSEPLSYTESMMDKRLKAIQEKLDQLDKAQVAINKYGGSTVRKSTTVSSYNQLDSLIPQSYRMVANMAVRQLGAKTKITH